MAFMASLVLIVLFAKVAAHAKNPFLLAAGFSILVAGIQWFVGSYEIQQLPHDPLARLGIRFCLAMVFFTMLTRSSSVLVWILALILAPLVCIV